MKQSRFVHLSKMALLGSLMIGGMLVMQGCAPNSALSGLSLPTDASALSGTWEGRYACGSDVIGATASLQGNALGLIKGRVTLHPVADAPRPVAGAYEVSGHFDTRGWLQLQTSKLTGNSSASSRLTFGASVVAGNIGRQQFVGSIPECAGKPFLFIKNGSDAEVQTLAKTVISPSIVAPSKPPMLAGTPISQTSLAKLFAKYSYDGTPKSWYPRVAITVHDWSRSSCWLASAVLWRAENQSEAIAPFTVCWPNSFEFALNNAANLHLFMEQTATESSGNVRNNGPKPPMLATPYTTPIASSRQDDYSRFIQQLVLDTGWQPGAPTNIWLVGFDANQPKSVTTNQPPAAAGNQVPPTMPIAMDAKSIKILERALSCEVIAIADEFAAVERTLEKMGWPRDGITPFTIPQAMTLFGLKTDKIAIARDGGEQIYQSFFPGISLQQLIKAAGLKLGKDRKTYGKATKVGVLTVAMEGSDSLFSCKVSSD